MIDYVRSMAENMQDGQNYVVLLIITDGGITGKYFLLNRVIFFRNSDAYYKDTMFLKCI